MAGNREPSSWRRTIASGFVGGEHSDNVAA